MKTPGHAPRIRLMPLRLDLSATARDRAYRHAAQRIDLAAVAAAYAAARAGAIRIGY